MTDREQKLIDEFVIFLSAFKIACPHFWSTSHILRQRKNSKEREHFDEGIKLIDDAVLKLEKFILEVKNDKN